MLTARPSQPGQRKKTPCRCGTVSSSLSQIGQWAIGINSMMRPREARTSEAVNSRPGPRIFIAATGTLEQEISQIQAIFLPEFYGHSARSEITSVSPQMNHPESVGTAVNEANFRAISVCSFHCNLDNGPEFRLCLRDDFHEQPIR